LNPRAIIEGGIIAFLISMGAGLLLGAVLGFGESLFLYLSIIFATWISLALGGWWAGSKAVKLKSIHGLLAGMVSLNISLPINLVMGRPEDIAMPSVLIAIFNSSLFGALGGFLAGRRRK